MRILVTGGAGFIGRVVVRQLIDLGHSVRVYDLVPNRIPKVESSTVCSILDPYAMVEVMRGCDRVMHMAAAVGVGRTEGRRLECLYVNIQGTLNVLEAAAKARIQKVLFISSSEVYGDITEGAISETSPLNPKSNYAISKLAGEELLRAFKEEFGLDYAAVRFFSVYGSGQKPEFVVPKFIEAVRRKEPPVIYGDGSQTRAFCHVEDAARGAILALLSDRASSEIFNIGNDQEPIAIRDLAERVIRLCANGPLKPAFVPLDQTERSAAREIYRRFPDIGKARRVLGYAPTVTLDEGIHHMWISPT